MEVHLLLSTPIWRAVPAHHCECHMRVSPNGACPRLEVVVLSPVKDYYLVWKVIEHNLLEVVL